VAILSKLRAYSRVVGKATRNRTDLVSHLVRRPALLAAVGVHETALFVSGKAPERLKNLASLRTSSMIGCPF
jgi:hypothetical protein